MTNLRQVAVSVLSEMSSSDRLGRGEGKLSAWFPPLSRDLYPILENREDREGIVMLGVDHAAEIDEVNTVAFCPIAAVIVTTEIGDCRRRRSDQIGEALGTPEGMIG